MDEWIVTVSKMFLPPPSCVTGEILNCQPEPFDLPTNADVARAKLSFI
jgi:hypothetical protein